MNRQELVSRTTGTLAAVYFRNGENVRVGDLILELDSRAVRAAQKEAQGAELAAQANLKLANDLVEKLSKSVSQGIAAKADLADALLKLNQAKGLAAQAQGAQERVKAALEDHEFRARFAGKVFGLPATLGQAVSAGQSLGHIKRIPECEKVAE